MNKYLVMVSLTAVLAVYGEKSAQAQTTPAVEPVPPVNKAALTEQAKAAVQALSVALKAELEAAMKTGGPVAAMSICKIKAPELAKAISTERGMAVKRVSLKNRNLVMGAANQWQTNVLNDFETRKAAGEDPATLAYAEVVDHEFRFMKAIPTAAVCLGCHGANLSPALIDKLTELYPQDQAIGYKEGDLRGAFVVVKNMAQ
jgi:hypothetical protein